MKKLKNTTCNSYTVVDANFIIKRCDEIIISIKDVQKIEDNEYILKYIKNHSKKNIFKKLFNYLFEANLYSKKTLTTSEATLLIESEKYRDKWSHYQYPSKIHANQLEVALKLKSLAELAINGDGIVYLTADDLHKIDF